MINVKFDTDKLSRDLDEIGRKQLPFAAAKAMTKTAQLVRNKMRQEMMRNFDRPTRYTLNSLYIKPAKKTDLSAAVFFKDEWSVGSAGTPATKFLSPHVEGGGRGHRSSERKLINAGVMPGGLFAVPGRDAPLNAYGNITGGKWRQITSGLSADQDVAGFQSNITAKSARRNRKRGRYFNIGGRGIGLRQGGDVKVMLWFVRAPRYQKRLDFYGIGEQIIREHLPLEFSKAFAEAMRTRRR